MDYERSILGFAHWFETLRVLTQHPKKTQVQKITRKKE
jgi:hypothetical protein